MKKTLVFFYLAMIFSSQIYAASCYVSVQSRVNSAGDFSGCIEDESGEYVQFFCQTINSYSDTEFTYNASYSSSACQVNNSYCKVIQSAYTFYFFNDYYNEQVCNLNNGSYVGQSTPTPTPLPPVIDTKDEVTEFIKTSGSVYSVSTSKFDILTDNAQAASAILTQTNSETTLREDDGSEFTVKANSLVTLQPLTVEDNVDKKNLSLLRGTIQSTVSFASQRQYSIKTPIGLIRIKPASSNRNSGDIEFSVSFNQDGLNAKLDVDVSSGSVEVIPRDGSDAVILTSQSNFYSISSTVPRTSWVLPIDGDYILAGKVNTIAWVEYPDAAGYALEYNFPSPVFAQDNPAKIEDSSKTIYFYPGQYTIIDGVVILELEIPDLKGDIVEARLFPVDASAKELFESVSSDKGTYTFK